jgi:hypothetical protein
MKGVVLSSTGELEGVADENDEEEDEEEAVPPFFSSVQYWIPFLPTCTVSVLPEGPQTPEPMWINRPPEIQGAPF